MSDRMKIDPSSQLATDLERISREHLSKLNEADLKPPVISPEHQMRLVEIRRTMAEHDEVNFRVGYLREGYEKGFNEGFNGVINEGIEKGIEKGIEGYEKGIEEGQHRLLLRLLELKFGPLEASVVEHVSKLRDPAELDRLAEAILTATRLEDLGLKSRTTSPSSHLHPGWISAPDARPVDRAILRGGLSHRWRSGDAHPWQIGPAVSLPVQND